MNVEMLRAWDWAEGGEGDLPGVGPRLRRALALTPNLKGLIAHGYFDLATPYFASKYVVERLALDQASIPNLQLRIYVGGHRFYTHGSAREQVYRDVEAQYRAAAPSDKPSQPR